MAVKSYHQPATHREKTIQLKIGDPLFEQMYELLDQIGVFWKNAPDRKDLRTALYTFMCNRMRADPCYLPEYENAAEVLEEFKSEYPSVEEAYAAFFTEDLGVSPQPTSLTQARQKVSDEFISLQLSLGGFKAFGARNYPSYISGAYIPGKEAPYRTAS